MAEIGKLQYFVINSFPGPGNAIHNYTDSWSAQTNVENNVDCEQYNISCNGSKLICTMSLYIDKIEGWTIQGHADSSYITAPNNQRVYQVPNFF